MTNDFTIAISGASKGIGRAIAEQFAALGWNVFVAARNADDLAAMQQYWASHFDESQLFTCVCDLATPEGCLDFVNTIKQETEHLHVLVNSLGVFQMGQLMNSPVSKLGEMLTANVVAAHQLTHGLVGLLKEAPRKHIINIGSVAVTDWLEGMNSYSVSKFAFLGWHQAVRKELKEQKIPVSIVHPGATLTASWEGVPTAGMSILKAETVAEAVVDIWNNNQKQDTDAVTIRPLSRIN